MSNPEKIDCLLMALIVVTLGVALVIYFQSTDYFSDVFAAEDHLVENATALGLLAAGIILARNARSLSRQGRGMAVVLTALYSVLFLFASGEEISWGQRVFGWQSGDFFLTHNRQQETNLHNLVIGNWHLASTIFGSGLTAVILLYLVVLPALYPRARSIKWLADSLAVPVPGPRHAVLAVAASIIIASIDVFRKWEVYELIFAILTVSIFLLPQNRDRVT